ncbi:TPA: hypothetical protein DCX15_01080 [bacterium]|nr:hypothetical protein [bacterium]
MKIGTPFKVFFKFFISFILILFLVKRVDLAQVWSLFLGLNYSYLSITLFLTLIIWIIHANRWQLLLSGLGWKIPFFKLMELNLIATFYTLFLPGYTISGGVVKAFKLTRLTGDVLKSALSIVIDRFMLILPRLLIIPFCLIINPPLAIDSKFWKAFICASFILLLIAIILGIMLSSRFSLLLERSIRPILQKLQKTKEDIPQSLKSGVSLWNLLRAYQNHRLSVIGSFGYGVASCFLNGLWFYFIAFALGVKIPFGAILWIFSIVTIVEMFPISIAGIGVREGTFVFLLKYYGVAPVMALSLSLIVFFFQVLEGGVGGLLEIWARR